MDKIDPQDISCVRELVLQLVSKDDPHVYDQRDVDYSITNNDGLIRMFLRQWSETHDQTPADISQISHKIITTLKWRKSSGLLDKTVNDFPLEIYQRNPVYLFESPDTLFMMYHSDNQQKVSEKFSHLCLMWTLWIHNTLSVPAAHAGKRVIMISDATNLSVRNMDFEGRRDTITLLDLHFPCLMDKTGVIGLPYLLVPVCNWFLRFMMTPSMRQRFRAYTAESLRQTLGPELTPTRYGGQLVMQDLLTVKQWNPPCVMNKDIGLEDWEIKKVLDYKTF